MLKAQSYSEICPPLSQISGYLARRDVRYCHYCYVYACSVMFGMARKKEPPYLNSTMPERESAIIVVQSWADMTGALSALIYKVGWNLLKDMQAVGSCDVVYLTSILKQV